MRAASGRWERRDLLRQRTASVLSDDDEVERDVRASIQRIRTFPRHDSSRTPQRIKGEHAESCCGDRWQQLDYRLERSSS